jgi:hypothetical protein
VLLESAMEIRLSSIRHLHAEAAGYAVGEGAAAGPPRPRSPAEAFPPRLVEVEA